MPYTATQRDKHGDFANTFNLSQKFQAVSQSGYIELNCQNQEPNNQPGNFSLTSCQFWPLRGKDQNWQHLVNLVKTIHPPRWQSSPSAVVLSWAVVRRIGNVSCQLDKVCQTVPALCRVCLPQFPDISSLSGKHVKACEASTGCQDQNPRAGDDGQAGCWWRQTRRWGEADTVSEMEVTGWKNQMVDEGHWKTKQPVETSQDLSAIQFVLQLNWWCLNEIFNMFQIPLMLADGWSLITPFPWDNKLGRPYFHQMSACWGGLQANEKAKVNKG